MSSQHRANATATARGHVTGPATRFRPAVRHPRGSVLDENFCVRACKAHTSLQPSEVQGRGDGGKPCEFRTIVDLLLASTGTARVIYLQARVVCVTTHNGCRHPPTARHLVICTTLLKSIGFVELGHRKPPSLQLLVDVLATARADAVVHQFCILD
jgi:hypothetical protein